MLQAKQTRLLIRTAFRRRHSPRLCYRWQVHIPSEGSPLRVGGAVHCRAQPALLPVISGVSVGAGVLVLPKDDGPLRLGCRRLRGRSSRPGIAVVCLFLFVSYGFAFGFVFAFYPPAGGFW